MLIYGIGCTHMKHEHLEIPKCDVIIHTGDESNSKNPDINRNECLDFLDWYEKLDVKYKIFVAGNHSTSIGFNRLKRSEIEEKGIIYLEHESVEIEGVKFFGSPYTPTFGVNWAFNKNRGKLYTLWEKIPEDTDILITHGPPLGICDHTYEGSLIESCGDRSLLNIIRNRNIKYHFFSHLHDEEDVFNAGIFKPSQLQTTFVNVAVVNLHHLFTNNGELIKYDKN